MRIAPALRGRTEAELVRLIKEGLAYVDGDTIVPILTGASAPPLSNTSEGGTDGVTITTGNSGGASGNAWNTVTIGASCTETFSATQAAHGGLALKVVNFSTPASTRVDWTTLGSTSTSFWFRTYIWIPAQGGTFVFAGVRTSAGTLSAEMYTDSSGFIHVHNAAGADIAGLTGAVAVPLSQWFRVEFRCLSNVASSEFEWRLFKTKDSTVADEAKSVLSGITLGSATDQIRWGQVTNPIASFVSYHDDLAVSTVDWIGPVSSPAVVTAPPSGGFQ